MVQFSETAARRIQEIAEREKRAGFGVRVMVVGGGCSGFTYDLDFENEARADDAVETQHGLKVFVDPFSAMYLAGASVDVVETADSACFYFDNPNARRTCGCSTAQT